MIGINHTGLLQDYAELHNETEATKEKLLILKQKKLTLLAEVRFLRHKYELLKNHPETQPKLGFKLPQNLKIRPPVSKKENRSQKREARNLNRRGGISDGTEATTRKARLVCDVNQKSRMCSKKEMNVLHYFPVVSQKERVYRAHEVATNTNMTPVFDLNQISREEEELQAGFEPLRTADDDELKNICSRSEVDAKNSDLMVSSMCRNVGNGSNRAGKRKISWQDRVALRA
ncbi:uncharacterized protein LOC111450577 [Cucurbita moschata]|uniref:Uncharacterized protein LOC111450577 n=1 Tax=Cucurbita moschata TaxID=3662 RepID=A0A6J1G446_CUCMO|nr:uncharacterized protein LOC111450577 [Cucurbita moschata]